ncbi:hypothetical protein BDV97DRAFT_367526 [Delphinella strobiligena]|nr:hypothetical protein BDV97DRAFT_367526 [Delphinella strobiligena]
MALQLQWNLDSASGSVFQIARGVLQAATSDNVQPIAIMACERLGATLVICEATRRKIEHLVAVTPEPGMIAFLLATVGFSANDCASHLSKSFAGIQFLGLAASLLTTLTMYESAYAIHLLLRESTADKTLVPTRTQIQDLLVSLQARCQSVGFANSVVGWQILLSRLPRLSSDEHSYLDWRSQPPSADGIMRLVDMMRQMYRLGPSSRMRAVIRSSTCVPWTIAFIEWCLGVAPSVSMSDGRTVLPPSASLITVVVSNSRTFDVEIYQSLASLAEIFRSEPSSRLWEGLVSFDSYAQWRLESMNFSNNEALNALVEACPYLLHQVATETRFNSDGCWGHSTMEWHTQPQPMGFSAEGIRGTVTSPFPQSNVIAKLLSRFLGVSDTYKLGPLADNAKILDLPLMSSYLTNLARSCGCSSCTSIHSYTGRCERCERVDFIRFCSRIVADILCLSLFRCPEELLFRYIPFEDLYDGFESYNEFTGLVESTMLGKGPHTGSTQQLVRYALKLVDHPVIHGDWVMSCYKGQAIYPLLFDTQSLEKRGYLTLGWMRGIFQHDGETYNQVLAALGPEDIHPYSKPYSKPSTQEKELEIQAGVIPSNIYTDLKPTWWVRGSENFLSANFSLTDAKGRFDYCRRYPMHVLLNLGSCIFADSCPHQPHSPLRATDPRCSYTGLVDVKQHLKRGEEPEEGQIGIVAVAGSDGLRYFALSTSELKRGCVIREQACLACCITICRTLKYSIVIL